MAVTHLPQRVQETVLANGLPFPDDPINTSKFGAGADVFNNIFSMSVTAGFVLAGIMIAVSLIRYFLAQDVEKKRFWLVSSGIAGVIFIVLGSFTDVLGILSDVGTSVLD